MKKTSSSTVAVEPRTLPPTSAAAKYHSLRVYHQIHFWMGEAPHVPQHQWGLKVVDEKMLPNMTDKPPAPQNFYK